MMMIDGVGHYAVFEYGWGGTGPKPPLVVHTCDVFLLLAKLEKCDGHDMAH